MIKVLERKGSAHVFSLKDKSTFRLLAHESKVLDERKVSDELRLAEKLGIIALIEIQKEPVRKKTPTIEIPKNSPLPTTKSGGTE